MINEINRSLYIQPLYQDNLCESQALKREEEVENLESKPVEAPINLTLRDLASTSAKILATAASIPFLSSKHLFNLGSWIIKNTGICPSSLFPSGTTDFFAKYIHYPQWLSIDNNPPEYRRISLLIKVLFPEFMSLNNNGPTFSDIVIKGSIFEEVVDRVLIQEMLLKRIPKAILKQVSPEHVNLVDHTAVRVARVFISSVFFALHHSWSHTCTQGDMYPYLIAGTIFGSLQEASGHPLYNTIAHMAANYTIRFRNG